jgi:surface protein
VSGIYTVRIYGTIQSFGDGLDTDTTNFDKLTEIVSFGNIQLESLAGGFKDATNLINVTQILPSTIISLKYTFYSASLLNDDNITYWDTSNVINMSYTFFNATSFKKNLENWDKSNVEEQYYMFYGSGTYEQNEDFLLEKILNTLF